MSQSGAVLARIASHMRLPRALPVAVLLFLALAGTALAQKTDLIVLVNGDQVTGEIKSYSEGRLTVDTFGTGIVSVKWNRIRSVSSDKQFEIQTADQAYHYGMLAPSTPPGSLDIVGEETTKTIEFLDVIRLAPIYARFWRRIEGSLDLGFTYTQANNYVQFNLDTSATVHRPAFEWTANLSAFFTSQQGVPSSQRASFDLLYQKFLKDRWSITGGFGLDRNIDLGLDLRVSLTAAAGRNIVQTNQQALTVFGGLTGDHESPVSGTDTYNLAAVLSAQYSAFTYDFPKVTVRATLSVIPYLTDAGRVRVQFNALAKREIIRDFYLSLSVFDSFDSRDPSTQQAKNDWGPILSIGWTF